MRGDGRGPEGRGPMTGRGLGNCLRDDDQSYNGAGPGRSLTQLGPGGRRPGRGGPGGRGPGGGMGRGRGRGLGHRGGRR